MFRQGPIPAVVHGLIEYAAGILLVAAPFLFSFDEGSATAAAIVAGVVVLVLTASTAIPTGLIKSIPVQAHVMLDFLIAIVLIAAPFIFGFDNDGTATAFFIIVGVAYLLMTIATRFVKDERQPRGRKRRRAAEHAPPEAH